MPDYCEIPPTHPVTCKAASIAAFAVGGNEVAPAFERFSEADRNRLVKGSKCPTVETSHAETNQAEHIAANHPDLVAGFDPALVERYLKRRGSAKTTAFDQLHPVERTSHRVMDTNAPDFVGAPHWRMVGGQSTRTDDFLKANGQRWDIAELFRTGECVPAKHEALSSDGVKTVLSHREWSGEFRIRTQTEAGGGEPPEQSGTRTSSTLSLPGARKLTDSCEYMAAQKGGYSTFLTLTLDEAARARVAAGETTIQKEISRFFDGAQKVIQRGWTNPDTGTRHPAQSDKLHYCWVVENPKNEAGEDNPHAHILMRWHVTFAEFPGWAKRIEKMWGQGFAHLEKIKDPAQAGAYMAKAAGYLTKGEKGNDQGIVTGNRYGISKPSRAPDWVCVGQFEAGIMGSLIADTHDYFSHKYGHVFARRRELNGQMDDLKKEVKAETDTAKKAELKAKRHRVGGILATVRKHLNELPAVVSKYQITFRTEAAKNTFIGWAENETGANMAAWLPVKGKGESWSAESQNKGRGLYAARFDQRQRGRAIAHQKQADKAEKRQFSEALRDRVASRAEYLYNQSLRRFNRWTGGQLWLDSVIAFAERFEVVSNNEGAERPDNWGFV